MNEILVFQNNSTYRVNIQSTSSNNTEQKRGRETIFQLHTIPTQQTNERRPEILIASHHFIKSIFGSVARSLSPARIKTYHHHLPAVSPTFIQHGYKRAHRIQHVQVHAQRVHLQLLSPIRSLARRTHTTRSEPRVAVFEKSHSLVQVLSRGAFRRSFAPPVVVRETFLCPIINYHPFTRVPGGRKECPCRIKQFRGIYRRNTITS